MLLPLLFFALSTYVLVKGADIFIENADKLGKSLHFPAFLTGVLIVAIGTSLPELATGIASLPLLNPRGDSSMLVGTVLGSNVANVFLGLGAVIALSRKNLRFKQNIFSVHFPILMIATVSVIFMSLDHEINRYEALILWGILLSYLWFLFTKQRKTLKERLQKAPPFKMQYVLWVIVGLGMLVGGAHFSIESILDLGEKLIQLFGVSESIWSALAATFIAIGTSLPEMVVVFVAHRNNNAEMAVGNILGSNIFNILMILGVGALLTPLTVSGINFTIVLPFSVASFFIYWTISKDQEITVQESLAMVFVYGLFLGKLYGWF